jgi:hypothetical protein
MKGNIVIGTHIERERKEQWVIDDKAINTSEKKKVQLNTNIP